MDAFFVRGVAPFVMKIVRASFAFDKWVIDALVNAAAWVTALISRISGSVDQHGVDGAVRGTGAAVMEGGQLVRKMVTGRIQDYVKYTVVGLIVLLLLVRLGLAFHPDFEKNGRFFVAYTAQDNTNTVAEYRVSSPGADKADSASGKVLVLRPGPVPEPQRRHARLRPGRLPLHRHGRRRQRRRPPGQRPEPRPPLLGKLLRIDVNRRRAPTPSRPTNPFVDQANARRRSGPTACATPGASPSTAQTGDLWIGDVGQNKYEEIDFQPANSKGGENYGWNIMEGTHCYQPAAGCNQAGLVKPIFEYDHGEGCSVTGGYVYRGKAVTALVGRYIFTDYCSATVWATTRSSDGAFKTEVIGEAPEGVSAFGEDEAGELYFTVDSEGAVYKVTAN